MRNKIRCVKRLVIFLAMFFATILKTVAQKKWDGGGGDSLWNNPLNWQPDGNPTANDTVVLDNQWITSSYHVYFPQGMITSHAFSLSIEPSSDNQISVTLPNTNTGTPGLILYAGDTALTLNNKSIFYNASGATAGNAIQLSGKIMIKNGGKYVHQTQRGNALLIANLVASPETQKGIFELNVPGNSAYTLSASGRTFGCLMLSGQTNFRKTYTSSGSNPLIIKGDLVINEQAAFSSSLTNNITVSGDMIIKGRFYLNPISGDSLGRCLETNGSNNTIEVIGQFNQGLYFRTWIISGNYKMMNSTINLDHAVGKIHLQSGTTIDLGNSIIKGAGEFATDNNCSLLSSASSIIGSDTSANIQTEYLSLHPDIDFTCYGSARQSTGDRFPVVISKLKVDKPQNNLCISTSIIISDSLILLNGKLISTDTSSMTIMNYANLGHQNSFFTGKLIHASKASKLNFPLGIGNTYTPIEIFRLTEAGHSYELNVDSLSPVLLSYVTLHPIQQLSSPVCWTIKTHQQWEAKEQAQFTYKKQQFSESDCIAVLDNQTKQWKLSSNHVSNDSLLIASIDSSTNHLFTLGKLFPTILPLSSIFLQKKRSGEELLLTWKVDDDENAVYYKIETSNDGLHYHTRDTVVSIRHKGPFSYSKSINLSKLYSIFYRISGIDIDGRLFKSNIVAEHHSQPSTQLFPNPASHLLYFRNSEKIKGISIIDLYGERKYPEFEQQGNMLVISIKELKPGYYFLLAELTSGRSTISFVKQ